MVRATCCICLEHKPDLLPWTRVWKPKCCNALLCAACAQKWREVSDICPHCRARPVRPYRVFTWQVTAKEYMVIVGLACSLICGLTAGIKLFPSPVIKSVPSGPMTGPVGHKGPPCESFNLRGPTGFPGPQGYRGPPGPVGPPR